MKTVKPIHVIAADQVHGDLLVHFSNDVSILYRARFLYDLRNAGGSVAVSNRPEEEENSAP